MVKGKMLTGEDLEEINKRSASYRARKLTKLAHEAAAAARNVERNNGQSPAGRRKTEEQLFALAGEKLVEAFDILMEKQA